VIFFTHDDPPSDFTVSNKMFETYCLIISEDFPIVNTHIQILELLKKTHLLALGFPPLLLINLGCPPQSICGPIVEETTPGRQCAVDRFPNRAYNPNIENSRSGEYMKVNHHLLAYKMQAQPNKTYKDLRQKQKAKISNWMYQATSEYYGAHGKMPEGEAAEQIIAKIYEKIKSLAIWVPYDEVHRVFLSKLSRYEMRIMEDRLSEPAQTQPKQKTTSTAGFL